VPHADHAALIDRFEDACADLVCHIMRTDEMTRRFGLAYLAEHFEVDTIEELALRDAHDEVRAEFAAELQEMARERTVLPRRHALGWAGREVFRV
jgi:hypothetical protein